MSHWASTWAYEQDIQPCGRKFVLVALAGFADEDGFCYPSQETLAEMTGQDVRSVRRHLASLDKDGVINRQLRRGKTGQRTSDGYTLQAPLSRLRPKRTECPVVQADRMSPDKLSGDISDIRFDPSVKKDPPLPPKGNGLPKCYKQKPDPLLTILEVQDVAIFVDTGIMEQMVAEHPGLPFGDYFKKWWRSRKISGGIGRRPRKRAPLGDYVTDIEGFFEICAENVAKQNGNGASNGHKKNDEDRPIWMASKK